MAFRTRLVASAFAAVACASAAWAQQGPPPAGQGGGGPAGPGDGPPGLPPALPPTITVTPRFLYADSAGIDGGGSVGVLSGGLEVEWADRNFAKRRFLTLTARAENVRYAIDSPAGRTGFEDMAAFNFSADVVLLRSQTRSTFFGLNVETAAAERGRFGTAFVGNGFVGEQRITSPTFAYSYGIAAAGQLEQSPIVFPLVGLEWQTRPGQLLRLRGTELRYSWGAAPSFGPGAGQPPRRTVSLLANVEPPRNFRLSDRSGAPEGVLRDFNVRAGIELADPLGGRGNAALFVGGVLYRQLSVEDRDGERVRTLRPDPALTVGGNLSLRF